MLKIFTDTTDFNIKEPTVVAIGKFDGDHKGHQKIFDIMRSVKKEKGFKAAVFTFYNSDFKQISPIEEKRKLMEAEGIDYCIEYPFNESTKAIKAADFLNDILINKLNMKCIVAGTDCSFGYNREGNADFLNAYSKSKGFDVIIIEKIKSGLNDISSTYIRSLLEEGRAEEVNDLLGHPYTLSGVVEEGNRIGEAKLGFATANIYPEEDKFIPKSGVYAVIVDTGNNVLYGGMTNIGINPSIVDDDLGHRRRIETHIFDFNEDIYGRKINVMLLKYIRDEIKFDSIDELKKQLILDERNIRTIVGPLMER